MSYSREEHHQSAMPFSIFLSWWINDFISLVKNQLQQEYPATKYGKIPNSTKTNEYKPAIQNKTMQKR